MTLMRASARGWKRPWNQQTTGLTGSDAIVPASSGAAVLAAGIGDSFVVLRTREVAAGV